MIRRRMVDRRRRPRLAPVTRVATVVAVLAAGFAIAAGAQPSDVPSGDASIQGRVVHAARPEAAAGVEVILYALPSGGVPGLRRGRSDAEGRFVFEGISADADTAYLVGARFDDVPYPGARVRFAAGERTKQVEVPIADVTSDAADLALDELELRLEWRGAVLDVYETWRLTNRGERTVHVAPARRGSRAPLVRAAIPAGVEDLRMPLGLMPEGLLREEDTLAFYGPVYTGEQLLEWSYPVAASAGELRLGRRLATPPARVVVLTPTASPELRSAALGPGEEFERDGRTYRRYEAKRPSADAPLEIALAVPPARNDAEAVELQSVRLVLEIDQAALRVSEEHRLRVSGDTRVVAGSGQRLFEVPLPLGAEELRFGANAAELGIVPSGDGGLSVLGPVPPGDSVLALSYRIPVTGETVAYARRFGLHLPLLTLFVADDGRLALESDRLHRRRPVRSADRSYAQLEAFEVAAGEEVGLRLATRPASPGLPRAALLGAFLATGAAALLALIGPLAREDDTTLAVDEEPDARREREAVYAALRDLEHDHETQKVADEDYDLLRDELRGRAVSLLRSERRSADPPPEAGPTLCPGCGRAPSPEHRFCAHCGAGLPATTAEPPADSSQQTGRA